MRIWTVHERQAGTDPVLVREGFAWLAFLFAGLWFAFNRMWLVLVIYLALVGLLIALTPEAAAPYAAVALQVLVGLHARDLRRWTLERRGWRLSGVVAARDEDGAWARLYARRPDLAHGATAA
jgi:hypothetical protein